MCTVKGGGSGCSKGISPLLAAVLLIAATVVTTTMLSGWVSTTMSTTQSTVANKTNEGVACAAAEIIIDDVYSGAGSGSVARVIVRNSGGSDNLAIISAQLYDKFGNNFTTVNTLPSNLNKGQMATLSFNYSILPTTTNDSAHGINNGTFQGLTTLTLNGKYGGAIKFRAAEADYLRIPAPSGSNLDFGMHNFTLEAWVYPTASTGDIFTRGFQNPFSGYTLTIHSANLIYFTLANTTNYYTAVQAATQISNNNWYHIAAVRNTGNTNSIYVDGILINTSSDIYGNITENSTQSGACLSIHRGCSPISWDFFAGNIDDAAIWNRSLTNAEINTSMNVGPLAVSNTNDLVGYWKFDEGKGVLSCPSDFSRVVVTTSCGGVSAEFSKTPKC